MRIVLTGLVFLWFGWECARRLARGRESTPLERATWAMSIAVGAWLGTLWILSLSHLLVPAALLARSGLFALAAAAMRSQHFGDAPGARITATEAAAIAVIVLWSAFILWRGLIVPPLSHDALAYHLPKAVYYARAGGYEVVQNLDPRARDIPVNYEMLLSELLVLERSDALAEWLSTFFYVALVIGAGALAERWWPAARREGRAAVCVLTAGVPVLLLHSGALKNDVMTAACMVFAAVTAGRWIRTGERFALLLSIAMFAAAAGTKPHGGLLALALVPFLAWRWKTIAGKGRELAIAAGFAVVSFLLLGGAAYLSKYAPAGAATAVPSPDRPVSGGALSLPVVYGDWSNLWQGPFVLLAAPFSPHDLALRVPWQSEPWFWRRYDLYISHAGIPFVVCALAIPFVLLKFRREPGPAGERAAILAAAAITFVVMLPVSFQPHGFYAISLPRYVAFLYPIVFAFVVPPLLSGVSRGMAGFLVALALFSFVYYAFDNVAYDDFVPPAYVTYAREHPGTRVIPFDPNRAASVVDRAAGPDERVAIEAAFGTWISPAFGADLRRPVDLIPAGQLPLAIPEAARWVVIDRSYDVAWGHPGFRDLSQIKRYAWHEAPSSEAEQVIGTLLHDRRFEVVFYNRAKNQAVFRRVR